MCLWWGGGHLTCEMEMRILISLSSPENSVQHPVWGEAPEVDQHHVMINTSSIPSSYHLLLLLLETGFALLALLLLVSNPALMVNARTCARTYKHRHARTKHALSQDPELPKPSRHILPQP